MRECLLFNLRERKTLTPVKKKFKGRGKEEKRSVNSSHFKLLR